MSDIVSRHNFGHAVDLTLIDLNNHTPLEMGACFDYFDELSHRSVSSEQIGKQAYENRALLSNIMQVHGVIPYEQEFWHFDYHECEVQQPMDIPICSSLRGLGMGCVVKS